MAEQLFIGGPADGLILDVGNHYEWDIPIFESPGYIQTGDTSSLIHLKRHRYRRAKFGEKTTKWIGTFMIPEDDYYATAEYIKWTINLIVNLSRIGWR